MLKLRKQMPLLRQRKLTPSLLEYLFTIQVSIMATSDNEDVDFLKDQVQRLNILLSQYQRKHLPSSSEEEQFPPVIGNGTSTALLTNKNLLSPLLVEYDHTVNELSQQISSYQSELNSLSSRMEQITHENARLHSELRKSLEAQLQSSARGTANGGSINAAVEGLQQQMDILSKERDSYIELWKQTSKELDTSQKSEQEKTKELLQCKAELVATQQAVISTKSTLEEMQSTCQQLDEERTKCLKTAQTQDKEIGVLQDELSQVRTELKAANLKNNELKMALDEITLQLKKREADRQRTENHEQSLDDRIHIMQINNADLEGKLLVSQREAALLKGEKTDLEESMKFLQSKVSMLEQREYEAILHVKESMQIVENALMEKEQSQLREQQQSQEINRLKRAMTAILQEAGERTRKEVVLVRQECNKNIDKMAEEIERLEMECGERQALVDRAERERKAVEKKLEKALSQTPLEMARTGETLHEMQSKVCAAERSRDDLAVKLEAANAAVKRLEASLAEEKQASEQICDDHRKWQRQVQEEMHNLREQKIKMMSQCDEVRQKLRVSEQARETSEARLVKEVACLKQKHEMKEKDLLCRLESSEKTHQKAIHELRNLVSAQHKVGTRWRDESKVLTQKFESTVTELKSEAVKYKRKSGELSVQLNHLRLTKDDLSKQLSVLNTTNTTLQHQLKDAESRADTATGQVSTLLHKEKQLLQERRELHRQLDAIKLHMARKAGNNLTASGIGASRLQGTLPPHIYHPSLGTPSHPHIDNSKWNRALSELQQSIKQVRQGLGQQQPEDVQSRSDGDTSEHSLFSRGDLSHHSSHSTLVHS